MFHDVDEVTLIVVPEVTEYWQHPEQSGWPVRRRRRGKALAAEGTGIGRQRAEERSPPAVRWGSPVPFFEHNVIS